MLLLLMTNGWNISRIWVIQVCYGMFERCLISLRYRMKWKGLEKSSPLLLFNSYYSLRNFCAPVPSNLWIWLSFCSSKISSSSISSLLSPLARSITMSWSVICSTALAPDEIPIPYFSWIWCRRMPSSQLCIIPRTVC